MLGKLHTKDIKRWQLTDTLTCSRAMGRVNLMMEAEEVSETSVFSSTLTRLIAREDFRKLNTSLILRLSRCYVITWGSACLWHLYNELTYRCCISEENNILDTLRQNSEPSSGQRGRSTRARQTVNYELILGHTGARHQDNASRKVTLTWFSKWGWRGSKEWGNLHAAASIQDSSGQDRVGCVGTCHGWLKPAVTLSVHKRGVPPLLGLSSMSVLSQCWLYQRVEEPPDNASETDKRVKTGERASPYRSLAWEPVILWRLLVSNWGLPKRVAVWFRISEGPCSKSQLWAVVYPAGRFWRFLSVSPGQHRDSISNYVPLPSASLPIYHY
jgi:hypothetical protein